MSCLTRQQVRAIDHYASDVLGVGVEVLMENAGRNAADAIEAFLGPAGGRGAAIVAGAGNNGGDGFVVARHMAMRGWRVATFLVSPEDKITGAAACNLRIIRRLGLDVFTGVGPGGSGDNDGTFELEKLSGRLREFDVVIDAIGGTGIRGELRDEIATAVEHVNGCGRPVVAIDIPTGLDCDTGRPLGDAVIAKLTVTFVARKAGFDAPGAADYTGKVVVADIGIPADVARKLAGK